LRMSSNGTSIAIARAEIPWSPEDPIPPHPWEKKLSARQDPLPTSSSINPPDPTAPPGRYSGKPELRPPRTEEERNGGAFEAHELVSLKEIKQFREETRQGPPTAESMRYQSDASFPVTPLIYRYIAQSNVFEAIHFETFMPGRPDLRFLRSCAVPKATATGDYFRVIRLERCEELSNVVKLSDSRFSMDYPLVWAVKEAKKMEFSCEKKYGIILEDTNVEGGVCVITGDGKLPVVPDSLVADDVVREPGTLVWITTRNCGGAHLYPVEMPGPKSWPAYVKLVQEVRTSSQETCTVTTVTALTAEEMKRIEDRLDKFEGYGKKDYMDMMIELFKLGVRFRENEEAINPDQETSRLDKCLVMDILKEQHVKSLCENLLYAIYNRSGEAKAKSINEFKITNSKTKLNDEQQDAVDRYLDRQVFCVQAPPGSGKTVVAATMAAAMTEKGTVDVQLLLSVQNVAVDNMAAALKKRSIRYGTRAYNMKALKHLDPHHPAPFDLFDDMAEECDDSESGENDTLKKWQSMKAKSSKEYFNDAVKEKVIEEEELMRDSGDSLIVLATVDVALRVMHKGGKLQRRLKNAGAIIIDEASLLPEATLFAICCLFPQARLVLIGDDRQLPPYRYMAGVLGHELAARSALSVAMRNPSVPVVRLTTVYRAPQSLIAPYNSAFYEGKLESAGKTEGERPLSEVELVGKSAAQLLLVDVAEGVHVRDDTSKSLHNEKEVEVLKSLLQKIKDKKDSTMIICLYDEQVTRVKRKLPGWTVHTVDSSQGKEASIVIVLTTRTKGGSPFFSCEKRCNVAISRAKDALIVLGRKEVLKIIDPWKRVVSEDQGFTVINTNEI
ncbi:hypothetical protein PFISCL1PPCAC_9140, partial [Pristionchus fissidentatus]